jgi:hypothetical protein
MIYKFPTVCKQSLPAQKAFLSLEEIFAWCRLDTMR